MQAPDFSNTSVLPLRDERTVTPVMAALAVAIVALSCILELTYGLYNPYGVAAVAACWLVTLFALFGTRLANSSKATTEQRLARVLPWMLGWTLVQFALLLILPQRADGHTFDATFHLQFRVLMAIATAATVVMWKLRARAPLTHRCVLIAIAVFLVAGALTIRAAPNPTIDVWVVEVEASRALWHGANPFSITFPDLYHGTSPYYPPGVSVGGRLQFGFVYPPLCLLLCLPGYLLGDPRYATMAAVALAAWLLARSKSGPQASIAALLILFTPRTFYVVHRAWTDPFVVMLTACVVYAAIRAPKYLYVAAGLYCCVKQHMFIGAPALLLLLPRPWSWRQVVSFYAKVGAVGLLVTLPLALWDLRAFINSVLNIREVFRTDSLGVLALLANTGVIHLSKWTGIGVAAVVGSVGLRFAPRSPAGFALLAGLTHFSLYLFSTHAFCNEYYNVLGALCIAFGVAGVSGQQSRST
jgi:hypothetical protein